MGQTIENEEDVEIIALNQDDDEMEFEEEVDDPDLKFNNLVIDDTRKTVKMDEFMAVSKQASLINQIANKKSKHDMDLLEFFNSLDFNPEKNIKGTVRASYKKGNQSYNLYAIPGQKPGDKGQVFIQSQKGFDNDLPPVRISDQQRDELVKEFKQIERLTQKSQTEDEGESINSER